VSNEVAVSANNGFMIVQNLAQAKECAKIIASSGFCPKSFMGKPDDVLVALQMGSELGLKPMQALQNIAIINGRPSLYGDAMIAVCRQAPNFEYIHEEYDEKDNSYTCRAKRKGEPEVVQKFSEKDARLAKLWGKQGPWTEYPKRMLQMRARGFTLRDCFPDLLRGIVDQSEAGDYVISEPKNITPKKTTPKPTQTVEAEVVEMEDVPFLNSELEDIRVAFLSCPSKDAVRERLQFYLSGYESKETKKTITAMAVEVVESKFKEETNVKSGSVEE
jgi:hypothetical protein